MHAHSFMHSCIYCVQTFRVLKIDFNVYTVKCKMHCKILRCKMLFFFLIKLWLLFSKFLKKIRFSKVVAIGQDSIFFDYFDFTAS